jgi:hypothetical protein
VAVVAGCRGDSLFSAPETETGTKDMCSCVRSKRTGKEARKGGGGTVLLLILIAPLLTICLLIRP